VRLLKAMAFRDLRAHRFWLDVKSLNTPALNLYRTEGFVEEGCLRESVRLGPSPGAGLGAGGADGYDSLIVMSLLDREYQARVALGLENAGPGDPPSHADVR
jgi:RimJ/RimL family protein N-acetyltransferase